jgi:S-adenosylmethionine uptake transporter
VKFAAEHFSTFELVFYRAFFSAFFSLFLFGDQIPWIGWGGILIIVLSGIAATALSYQNQPSSPS